MKKQFLTTLIGLSTVSILFFACQKSSSSVSHASSNQQTLKMNATNNIVSNSDFDEENFDMVMGAGEFADDASVDALSAKSSKCFTVTYDPSKDVYPHTKTIDYGTGCTNESGITKKGKVIITYYDPLVEAGGLYTVTNYDNYYVNDVHIEGSIQINKIKNGTGQTVFLHLIRRTLSDAAGDVKDYNAEFDFTLVSWQGVDESAYQITGHSVGSETLNGIEANNFQTNTDDDTNPVFKSLSCRNRVQGGLVATIHISNGDPSVLNEYLNYGDGSCDRDAVLTVNDNSSPVTLPLQFWPLNL